MSFVNPTPTFNSTQPDEQAIEMDIELADSFPSREQ